MSLLFKFDREKYNPNNSLDMYDLVVKLQDSEVKLQRVTEEYKRLYKRYLAMLESEEKKIKKRDYRGRFISSSDKGG